MTDLISRLVTRFGSEAKLAAAAGVSQPVINAAKRTGKIGPRLAIGIADATGGEVPRHVLRPDLWQAPFITQDGNKIPRPHARDAHTREGRS